jgi:AcrR family transcriptional regulator
VIDGAMSLFAVFPVEEVTVLDIATAVDMTPAAVYYHFASKEQVLIEGMQLFSDRLYHEIETHLPAPGDIDGMGTLLTHVLNWVQRDRAPAYVYFVSSVGLNLNVEARRRVTRIALVELLRDAVRQARGDVGKAEASVIAVALLSLLETAASSMLNHDAMHRSLAGRLFADEVESLALRICGGGRVKA